jgi:hypothetical protein
MSDEPIIHNLEDLVQPPEVNEPAAVLDDCKIHNEIKNQEPIFGRQAPQPPPKKILKPWYEMLDKNPL